jgi:small-conductance mechanosensitive channel
MGEFWRHAKILESIDWKLISATTLRVVVIVILAAVAIRLLGRLTDLFHEHVSHKIQDVEQIKRAETLGRVFRYVAGLSTLLIAGMLVLSEIGVSIGPILGAAGVVGVAVGFGAQSLIKDYFTGFFILVEDQIRQGDVVEAGGKTGLVEEITLRHLRLRDYDGTVYFVPNNLINTVSNKSRAFAYAVMDVGVAYHEDLDHVFGVMRRVGEELRRDETFGPKILAELEIAGVENWADSAVTLRSRFMVRPLAQWDVRREFLRRLKKAFDSEGIEIPYPHLTVYAGRLKDGTAPPFHLATAGVPAPIRSAS